MATFVREVQRANVLLPMLVTPLGIVTLVRLPHPENKEYSMLVRLSGSLTLARLEQSWKAAPPIEVTLLAIMRLASPLHWEKAPCPMVVTL